MISEIFIIFLVLILTNLFLFSKNYKIANYFNLMDVPDKKRKIHKINVPLTGGLFLFLNIMVIFFLKFFLFSLDRSILNLEIIFFIFVIFLFGIIDDKFGINSNLKLALSIIIFSLFLYVNDEYVLRSIIISNGTKFYLGNFGIPFTVFCLVIFQNAFNMYDGINLQNISYFVILVLIIFIFYNFIDFYIYLSPVLLFLAYLNYNNKLFLGDSGSYILSFLISIFLIYIFNQTSLNIKSDLVFLFLCIPGYDLLRLAIVRILNNKHPFNGDQNHIHHILIKKIGYSKTIIYLNLTCFGPILFSLYFNINFYAVFFSLILYILTILYFKNDKIHTN